MDLTFLLSVASLQQEIHASTKLDQSDDDDEHNVQKVWAQLVDLYWWNFPQKYILFIIH